MTSCCPHIFNKFRIVKILHIEDTLIVDDKYVQKEFFKQINGSNYDMIVNYVNNNTFGISPWETTELASINTYLKKLKSI